MESNSELAAYCKIFFFVWHITFTFTVEATLCGVEKQVCFVFKTRPQTIMTQTGAIYGLIEYKRNDYKMKF